MKKNLSTETVNRRVLETDDPIEKVLSDAYFNPFKFRLSVDDVITVNNGRRHQLVVTQIEPFVKTEYYMDYDARLEALEAAVAELTGANKPA